MISRRGFLRLGLAAGAGLATSGAARGVPLCTNKRVGDVANGKVIWLFADGNDTLMSVALPVLRGYGHVGTAIICPTIIGGANKCSLANLLTLKAAGWEVGSHGYSHLDPTTLPDSPPNPWAGSLQEHLQDSRTYLTLNGLDDEIYGPPLGCNAHVLNEATAVAGYTHILASAMLPACWTVPAGWTYAWESQNTYDWASFLAALALLWNNPLRVTIIVIDQFDPPGAPGHPTPAQFDQMVHTCACTGVGCTLLSAL